MHGGASVLWGRHLVCRKLLAPPSVQQVHRCRGFGSTPCCWGRKAPFPEATMETLQRGSVHLLYRAPCHGLCSHHRDACARGAAEGRPCLGVTVPLPAPGPVPVQLPPRCRCRGVGGPSVGHPGLSSHGAVSWQRGDQQDCPMPSRCGHFLCLLHLSQLVLLTAVWGEVMMYLFICIPRCQ